MPRTARLSNRARRRLCAVCTAWMRWSTARPIQLAGTVSQTAIAVSAANQPRIKYRLLRIWIERSRDGNVTTRLPRGRCEAVARQRLEAAFGLRQRFQIFRVKMMTGIACVIHDDLRSHRRISTVWVSLPARSNCNRNTTRRMFKNAAARILPRNCALALRRKRSSPLPPHADKPGGPFRTFVALVCGRKAPVL